MRVKQGFFTCQCFPFAIKIASVQFMHENYCAGFVFLTKIVKFKSNAIKTTMHMKLRQQFNDSYFYKYTYDVNM